MMNYLKSGLWIFLCTFFFMILISCNKERSLANKTITVSENNSDQSLFYAGSIQPLNTHVIPAPAEGVVVEMPFQYGDKIEKNQLLFLVSSTKFLSDYKAALMQYVKTKNDFTNSQTQLSEAKFLHQHELISEDDFKAKQSNFYSSQLSLLQAKDALQNLLHQMNIKDVNLYNLTIADIDKITQALHLQKQSETIKIVSPRAGIILSTAKHDDETKKLRKGDIVKQGDVLAVLGDLSGLRVEIKVNEMTVNQLSVGQKVKVTGIAFPNHTLVGEISHIDKQGEPSGSGLPNFTVKIVVLNLTKEQQKEIHVGMSAKVEIALNENKLITIPITAVQDAQDGSSMVNIIDPKTKKLKQVAIKTGKTSVDSVVVLAGLKSGDQLVIPN